MRRSWPAPREALALFPDRPALYYDEAESLLAVGRTDELAIVVDRFEGLEAPFIPFLVTIAAEAEAHGHPDVARSLLDRAVRVYSSLPADIAGGNSARNWMGIANHARGDYDAAAKLYRELIRDVPDNDWYRSYVAVLAAERGDRRTAEAEIRRLLDKETPDDAGDLSLYAANIAAALGDGDRFVELTARARAAGALFNGWDHRWHGYRKIRAHPGYLEFIRPTG